MKAISITKNLGEAIAFKPSQHFNRIGAMPYEVVECYDAESVYEHGESADVVFLPGAESSWPLFWNDIASYISQLKTFVGIFSIDSYRTVWPPGRNAIDFDALFPLMYAAYKEYETELAYTCDHVFWSPCCVDVQQSGIERDIDVLFWGNPGLPHYPFRNFALCELVKRGSLESIQDELILSSLRLNGVEYSQARIPYRNASYWGYGLYPALERARICIAGSMLIQAPHPKYFENAACGCVTITNDFSDRTALGFEHGENIWITDEESFIKDLTYLLENDTLLSQMGANARQLIAERHTVARRALELYSFLQRAI